MTKEEYSYLQDTMKIDLYGTTPDENGKYMVCFTKNVFGGHAYFFDIMFKKVRISATTFRRLIDEGKAVEVDRNGKKINLPKEKS